EVGGAGEEREGRGHRASGARRRERDAVHEVVPRDEERDERRREHARRGERDDRLAERLPRRRAVDLRRLLELPRDLAEERREGPDGDRERERQVRDDEAGPRVVEADVAPQVEQGRDDRDHGEDRDAQRGREDEALAREVEARDRVGAQRREDHRDDRRDERDADRVAQRGQEQLLRRPPAREDLLVVLRAPPRRQERPGVDVARRLEARHEDRHHGEQRTDEDDDRDDGPPDLGPGAEDAAHHFSPLAPARSTLKSLIATKQMSTTHRNSSTEMAEPMPIWSWPIEVR